MVETKSYKTPQGEVITREEHSESGKFHRLDGPALVCSSGLEAWLVRGRFHRMGEPAITDPTGYRAWWEDGVQLRVEFENGRVYRRETEISVIQ